MHSFSVEGIVLKRVNVGEADRVVTVFSKERGKFAAIAKGIRKPTSTKRSALEPGMQTKLLCVEGKGLPIITQAVLLQDLPHAFSDFQLMRDVLQVLEIVDAVTVEEESQERMYDQLVLIFSVLNATRKQGQHTRVRELLNEMVQELGFYNQQTSEKTSVTHFVESIIEKKLRAFSFLTVKTRQ